MKTIFLFLTLAIIFESTITTLPLVLLIILFLAIIKRSNDVYVIAFFAGLFLDLLTLGRFGLSSLYFTVLVYLVYIYQKKFEIQTLHFVVIFSFLGSFFYLFLTGVKFALPQSIMAVLILGISFIAFNQFNKKVPKYI